MKKKTFLLAVCSLGVISFGCSGPTSTARNIETGAAIVSVGGVSGAAPIGVAASLIDIFSGIGKPKVGKASPVLLKHIFAAPMYWKTADGKVERRQRKSKEGKLINQENAPQISMDYTQTYSEAVARYQAGDFGDGGPDAVKKNLEAWRDGKLIAAEYNGPNGVKVIIVSDKNEPGEAMVAEEWVKR